MEDQGNLRKYLEDLMGFKQFEYRRQEVVLKVARHTVGTASDDWKTPADVITCIEQIRGHLAVLDWDNEPAMAAAIGTNVAPLDRVVAKSMNCRVRLENADTKVPIFEDTTSDLGLSLFTLLEGVGGTPFRYHGVPHIVKPGQTIRMTAQLISNATGVLGNADSEYGVVLSTIQVYVGK